MVINLETRETCKGSWWCNGTIDGYDYSFEGSTIAEARHKMMQLIGQRVNREYSIVWEPIKRYQPEDKLPSPQIRYAKTRIDYLK